MKLIKKDIIEFNINHSHDISAEMQDTLNLGNCQFIVDASDQLKLSPETASVAMIYMQLFYLHESYLENERELLCCAALFVASKIMY